MPQDDADREYDVVVIGAGPVGENVADRAVQGGLSAVIVEDELVGGECSYWACMPTKALLRSGSALRAARRVPAAAQAVTGELDVAALLARRTSFTSDWDDAGQVQWLDNAGIDLVRGRAELTGERAVTIQTDDGPQHLTARVAVAVCTGTDALVPDIPGLVEATPWTSREATAVQQVPGSLAIVGGGVVACEMATIFADLGTEVTIVVRGPGLLSGAEPFAGEAVAKVLTERGVQIRFETQASAVIRSAPARAGSTGPGPGAVTLRCDDGAEVTCDEVLIATGRTPRTQGLGLPALGLTDGEWLGVDDTLRVQDASGAPIDWLYAVGDVNGRALLTHQGKYQARAVGDAIAARAAGAALDTQPWGAHVATADGSAVPQVIFTDPEVASVGLTAAQANDQGLGVRVVDIDLGTVAGAALHADGYTGQARMVVDTEREVLLGMTFVGSDVAELIHAGTVAVAGQVPLARLWHAVPSYPTISEVWLRLLEGYGRPG